MSDPKNDPVKLRATIVKVDALLAKYREATATAEKLKRCLVLKLLRAEHPERQLSIHDAGKGLLAHGLKP